MLIHDVLYESYSLSLSLARFDNACELHMRLFVKAPRLRNDVSIVLNCRNWFVDEFQLRVVAFLSFVIDLSI